MYKQKPIDMKTKTMNLLLAAALCLMCCAACTDAADDIADGTAPAPVPFTFTAVPPPAMTNGDGTATTRAVPGRDAWKGDGTEKIRVYLLGNGIDIYGTYTITATDGTATALPGDQLIFWPDKEEDYELNACYPLPGTYDITDQSTPEKLRQADFLVADVVTSYAGSIPVNLQFGHAMAKVRVELTGVNATAGEIKVEIWGYTGIILSYRTVGGQGDPGYITACRDTGSSGIAFEAMVTAGYITKQDFIRITIGSKTYHFTPAAGDPERLFPGHVYTYRITIPASTNP